MWIFLILFAVISFSIARITQKRILSDKHQDPITYAIYFELLVSLIIFSVAIFNNFQIPPLTNLWPYLIAMTLLYSAASIFSVQAMKRIPISEFMIILATTPLWTALTSIPLLHESASTIKMIGIILTVIGIAIAFYDKSGLKVGKGQLLAFVTAACYGLAFTNDAFLLGSFNSTTYSTIYFVLPALFMAILYPQKTIKPGYLLNTRNRTRFLVSSFLFALAAMSVNTAFKLGGEISQISAILQLNAIVTVGLGIVFLKEKDNTKRKILGGIVVVLGAILVGLK